MTSLSVSGGRYIRGFVTFGVIKCKSYKEMSRTRPIVSAKSDAFIAFVFVSFFALHLLHKL